LLLAWVGLNLFDEPLDATASAMLVPPADPLPADQNLYVAMIGFDAPPGQSIFEAGEARIERGRGAVHARGREALSGRLAFRDGNWRWAELTASIWSLVKTHRTELAAVAAANHELLERYRSLHDLQGYSEGIGRPGSFAPAALVLPQTHQLFLAEVANQIQTGAPSERRAALLDLQQDFSMWRRVLDGDGGLLARVLAATLYLHSDILFAGDMVTDPDFDLTGLQEGARSVLSPFDLRDWMIGDAYLWEMRRQAAAFAELSTASASARGADARWASEADVMLARLAFKRNATDNLEAERAERLRALANGDPATFADRRAAYRQWAYLNLRPVFWRRLYNPIGRELVSLSPEDDYPERVFDVAALQRLAFLAYEIRRQGVSRQEVAGFMRGHPQWATNPMDAKPFFWNAATGVLAVMAGGKVYGEGRFSFRLDD
jgi:hypothetical protein